MTFNRVFPILYDLIGFYKSATGLTCRINYSIVSGMSQPCVKSRISRLISINCCNSTEFINRLCIKTCFDPTRLALQ